MTIETAEQLPPLWTFKIPKSHPGNLRDAEGKALNGFKVQDSKKNRKVSIVTNGRYMRHYRFPRHVVAPRHPMISWWNTPMCGITLEDADGNLISFHDGVIKAVLNGKKPVGDIMFWNSQKEECHLFLMQAEKLGLEISEEEKPFKDTYFSVMVGVPKTLKELFDLEAIAQFYHVGTELPKEYFLEHLMRVSQLTPVRALKTYDWCNPNSCVELMLTGLCLGYALESTLALMLE